MDITQAVNKQIDHVLRSLHITADIDGDGEIEINLIYGDETLSTCYVPLTRFVEKVIEDNTHEMGCGPL